MYILEPQYPWLLTRSGQVYNHDRSYLTRLNLNWSQDIHLPGNRQLSYAWGLGLPVSKRLSVRHQTSFVGIKNHILHQCLKSTFPSHQWKNGKISWRIRRNDGEWVTQPGRLQLPG